LAIGGNGSKIAYFSHSARRAPCASSIQAELKIHLGCENCGSEALPPLYILCPQEEASIEGLTRRLMRGLMRGLVCELMCGGIVQIHVDVFFCLLWTWISGSHNGTTMGMRTMFCPRYSVRVIIRPEHPEKR